MALAARPITRALVPTQGGAHLWHTGRSWGRRRRRRQLWAQTLGSICVELVHDLGIQIDELLHHCSVLRQVQAESLVVRLRTCTPGTEAAVT